MDIASRTESNIKALRIKAEKGDMDAQRDLGYAYRDSKGVQRNYAVALKWFSKAAQQGSDTAELGLAKMYEDGMGVQRNYVIAYMWLSLAASSSHYTANIEPWRTYLLDAYGAKLTASQKTQAQKMAQDWQLHHVNK